LWRYFTGCKILKRPPDPDLAPFRAKAWGPRAESRVGFFARGQKANYGVFPVSTMNVVRQMGVKKEVTQQCWRTIVAE